MKSTSLPSGRIVGIGVPTRPTEIRQLANRLEALEKTAAPPTELLEDWIGQLAGWMRRKTDAATSPQTYDWIVRAALQHLPVGLQELLRIASEHSEGPQYTKDDSVALQALESEVELIYQL